MLKTRLIIIFLLIFHSLLINAQKYYIPDNTFRNYLVNNYPYSMSGDSLITDSTTLSNITILDVSNEHISDLSGIEYFTTLQSLNCHSNNLSVLPSLPASIKFIYCFSNHITVLPPLPQNLEYLACGSNLLSHLSSFPKSLKYIDCQYNFIDSLPPLPDSLNILLCGDNLLSKLPPLPSKINSLNLTLNNISVLPQLPESLEYLGCEFNGINSLPSLPTHLKELDCSYNNLSNLPVLPSTLQRLSFINNSISSIPTIAPGLNYLGCSANKLDFSDIVPVMNIPNVDYTPQDSIGIGITETVDAGNDFSIDATVGYNSFNSYHWYKNNQQLNSDSRINVNTGILQISLVQHSDSGYYYCSITNSKAPALTLYFRRSHLSVTGTDVTGLLNNHSQSILAEIFPNPTSEKVCIRNKSNENLQIQITSMQGILIWEGTVNKNSENIVDVSELKNGVYILSGNSNLSNINQKLIIE